MALTEHEDGSITNERGQVVKTVEGEVLTPEAEKTALEKAQEVIASLKAQLAGKSEFEKPEAEKPEAADKKK